MADCQHIADAGFAELAGTDLDSLAAELAEALSHRDDVLDRLAKSLAMVASFAG